MGPGHMEIRGFHYWRGGGVGGGLFPLGKPPGPCLGSEKHQVLFTVPIYLPAMPALSPPDPLVRSGLLAQPLHP